MWKAERRVACKTDLRVLLLTVLTSEGGVGHGLYFILSDPEQVIGIRAVQQNFL